MSNENMKFEFESEYGGKYIVSPWINMYKDNDNLYLGLYCQDKGGEYWEPFCDVTVNTVSLAYLESAVDTNNNGAKIVDFLEANGFGQRTPYVVSSGFCTFPIFKFNEDRLKEIDPKVFTEYQKAYGQYKQPLAEKIAAARAKTDQGDRTQPSKEKGPDR